MLTPVGKDAASAPPGLGKSLFSINGNSSSKLNADNLVNIEVISPSAPKIGFLTFSLFAFS